MMKKIFVALVIALALTGSVVAGTASAHSAIPTHAHLTCVNTLGDVIYTGANTCPPGYGFPQGGLRCVQPDGVVYDTTANHCNPGDIALSSDGLAFGGSFGARFFQPGFDFGTLSDQQTAQDANACAAAIAFIETQHLGPLHRAAAIGLIAQLQQCQNRTGSNSNSFWPF